MTETLSAIGGILTGRRVQLCYTQLLKERYCLRRLDFDDLAIFKVLSLAAINLGILLVLGMLIETIEPLAVLRESVHCHLLVLMIKDEVALVRFGDVGLVIRVASLCARVLSLEDVHLFKGPGFLPEGWILGLLFKKSSTAELFVKECFGKVRLMWIYPTAVQPLWTCC